jgi:23S rRNA (adenine2503-C2)-methyltransferase
MIALQGITPEALATALGATLAETRKIVSCVQRDKAWREPIVGVTRVTMDALRAHCHVPELAVRAEQASQVDPFVKYVLETHDHELVETVRIPLERAGRFSVCVSSQVGCALDCAFCATGRMGLRRNLETWEIVEQVRVVRRGLENSGESGKAGKSGLARVHGVVFQGMGEPLANLDRVLEAIAVMCEPSSLAIDARAMTVCTSGLPSGIRRLAREAPKVRLGMSIASARRDVRKRLMPIEKSHGLDEVIDAAAEHARITGLSPMWAVTPLAGVNDAPDDARALADLARAFAERTGVRPRISVIPYNAIGEDDPFTRASEEAYDAFAAAMTERGVHPHRRYSGGGDVSAACGQLQAEIGRNG